MLSILPARSELVMLLDVVALTVAVRLLIASAKPNLSAGLYVVVSCLVRLLAGGAVLGILGYGLVAALFIGAWFRVLSKIPSGLTGWWIVLATGALISLAVGIV